MTCRSVTHLDGGTDRHRVRAHAGALPQARRARDRQLGELLRACVFDPDDHSGFLLADQLVGLPARVDVVTRPEAMWAVAPESDLLVVLGRRSGAGLASLLEGFRVRAGFSAPVLVLSEMTADAVRINALVAGADYALTLPVSAAELHAVVRRLTHLSTGVEEPPAAAPAASRQ